MYREGKKNIYRKLKKTFASTCCAYYIRNLMFKPKSERL